MRSCFLILMLTASGALPVAAACTPLKADVVSLGKETAHAYAERSMASKIKVEKDLIESVGKEAGRITESEFSCTPFGNVLGADEWRCVGHAKVCTK
jgi:hypothetical protein